MNALKARARYDEEQARIRAEKERGERNALLATMTPEERQQFFEEEEKRNCFVANILQSSHLADVSSSKILKQFVNRYGS